VQQFFFKIFSIFFKTFSFNFFHQSYLSLLSKMFFLKSFSENFYQKMIKKKKKRWSKIFFPQFFYF